MEINLINFIKEDIWLIHEQTLPPLKAAQIRLLKIIILSIQGFVADLCPLRASALTLYSILSIVPVIAMLFGIAKGFGFENMLEERLIEQVPAQETMVLQLISFAQNLLNNARGGVVAGIGVVVLFWTIINVISNIEVSFNHIWKIGKDRSISRKFSDYLSLMLLAPVVLIAASSMSVFLQTKITWLITIIQLPEFAAWLVIRALALSPLVLMIGLFSFTYIFVPNHKINYRYGIIAGVIAGVMYHLSQWAYLSLQIGVTSYNAIYGSFAALPLFVVWLQIGWMIVLYGCELAFFLQNYETYRNNKRFSDLSFSRKKVIALQITHLIIKNFIQLRNPLNAEEIAAALVIPIAIIHSVIAKLIASHILIELKNQDVDDEVYLPAVDINILTVAYVVNALEQCGQNDLPEISQEQLFNGAVNNFRALMEASEHNRLIKEL